MARALVIGSGPGGSIAAMTLAKRGWDVTIFEKGPNYFDDLTSQHPRTVFSNDELKHDRHFARQDPDAEPRVYRTSTSDPKPQVGIVQSLAQTVGGGTAHWDAKTPRFWDIDFQKLTLLGPQPGAGVIDWPFTYQELAPLYEEVESLIGVAGDVSLLPVEPTLTHAPRSGGFPMPAGPPMYSSTVVANGASSLGLHPFVVPMAINSEPYDGRPACANCGFCVGYGCPIMARVGGLAPLRHALLEGAELRAESNVTKVNISGSKATGVTWVDASGTTHAEQGDLVVMAMNAIETPRLALLSELPDPHQVIGRYLMFHWFTDGTGIYFSERLHAHRGRGLTHDLDDFADPDFPGARAAAQAAGLPYFRGGTLEMGGSQLPLDEAANYQQILSVLAPHQPFGTAFKQLMRDSLLRDRLAGITLVAEDLPYATNQVDLDPRIRDWRGVPVPRITYGPGRHEIAAQTFYMRWIVSILKASGADVAMAIPELPSAQYPVASGSVPDTEHVMGGMRMGDDPGTSVTDSVGRYHHLDNVVVSDGSVFPSSGGHNPTLTIMATALRNSRQWA
jgi:choline dehydrogenase-like flavoprotein